MCSVESLQSSFSHSLMIAISPLIKNELSVFFKRMHLISCCFTALQHKSSRKNHRNKYDSSRHSVHTHSKCLILRGKLCNHRRLQSENRHQRGDQIQHSRRGNARTAASAGTGFFVSAEAVFRAYFSLITLASSIISKAYFFFPSARSFL